MSILFGVKAPEPSFRRGDADGNARVDIAHPIRVLGYLFLGQDGLPCLDAADADDSGTVLIPDAIYGLAFLFAGGPPPPSPFPECGNDPAGDGLDCRGYLDCD